jgi:hypothetical protein
MHALSNGFRTPNGEQKSKGQGSNFILLNARIEYLLDGGSISTHNDSREENTDASGRPTVGCKRKD